MPGGDGRDPTILTLNPIVDVFQGGSFTVSGNLTSAGVELSGKNITFTDLGIPDLPTVITGGIEFVRGGPEGIKVEFCANCPVDDERKRTEQPGNYSGNNLLLLKTGGIINLPLYTRGITLELHENSTRHIEFEITKADGSTYIVNSTGMAPYIAVFTLIQPDGIKSLKINKVVNNASDPADPDTPLRIGSLQTFDLRGNPEQQHYITFEPPIIAAGAKTSPWEVNPGYFFVTGYVPIGTPASDIISRIVTAHFAGDDQYAPDDSDTRSFLVLETSLAGSGGEGSSTSYSGSFYTTFGGCPVDSDGDAICDEWETSGVPYLDQNGNQVFYSLSHPDDWGITGGTVSPKVGHRDVFVELDFMQGHTPDPNAIVDVITAFGNTPVITNSETDDFGWSQGITLHVDQDETLPHRDTLNAWRDPSSYFPFDANSTNDFVSLKIDHFGTEDERDQVWFSFVPPFNNLGPAYNLATPWDTSPGDWDTSCSDGTINFKRNDIRVSVDANQGFKGRMIMTTTLDFDVNPGTVAITNINRINVWAPLAFDGSATGTVTTYPPDSTTRTIVITIPFKTNDPPFTNPTNKKLADVTVTLSCSNTSAILEGAVSPTLQLSTARLDAKAQVYHYAMFIHSYQSACSSSGLAETPGNDFIVSLGCDFGPYDASGNPIGHSVGTTEEQAGTFMHELGHNLGLGHGGPLYIGGVLQATGNYNDNCKPNYPSVMSYSRQFPIFFPDNNTWREKGLDYSRQPLVQLNEWSGNKLDEPGGNQLTVESTLYPSGQYVIHGSPTGNSPYWERVLIGSTPVNIDWKMEGLYLNDQTQDTNKFSNLADPVPGCTGAYSVHNGFDDWSNLTYLFRGTSGSFDGMSPYNAPQEVTPEAYQSMKNIAAYAPGLGWIWWLIIGITAAIIAAAWWYVSRQPQPASVSP